MDSATYDSTLQKIIASRGTRVYRCDANTGAVEATSDCPELGLGGSCVVYDSGLNQTFISAWNTAHYDVSLPGSVRNFYRVTTNPLAVGSPIPFGSTFGLDAFALTASPAAGIMAMKNVGGQIYALGWSSRNAEAYFLQFSAAVVGLNFNAAVGDYSYPSIAFAVVAGKRTSFCTGPGGNEVISWNWDDSTGNNSTPDNTRGYVCLEYAVNRIYVAREFQFIDIYDTALNYVATIDTMRTNFQATNMLLNPTDGLLYVAGGVDNTVLCVNPNGGIPQTQGAYPPIAGKFAFSPAVFDLPWNLVFTTTKKFAVQQGAVGLNAFV